MPSLPRVLTSFPLAVVLAGCAPAGLAPDAAAATSSLPRVEIDARGAIRDDPKVRARVRVTDPGAPGASRRGNAYDGWAGIELRGQSAQRWPKKSFALETRSRAGENRSVGLLGMPKDNDWVLYAAYTDKTLMRNVVAYETARWIGPWAARTRFVEVTLNGRYEGVYVLMESVELDDGRIEAPGKGLTGAYLAEVTFDYQARRKGPFFRTPVRRQPVVYEEPARDELSTAEARYLRGVVARAERALYRGRPGTWRRHLDESSAVDYVLMQELFRNADAFRASTFLVKAAGAKLAFGPIWDLDLAMANARRSGESPRGWHTRGRYLAERLHRDPGFRRALAARWRGLRERGLEAAVLGAVDTSAAELRGAAGRNFRRWDVLGRRLWRNPAPRGGHRAEVRFLRSWLARRIDWMDRALR